MLMKVAFYTILALFAFAGNSVLCRLALGENAIDAASFTSIRLLSGIAVLAVILKITQSNVIAAPKGSWKSSFILFVYAVTFSYAYISLETGTGALILFACVQITMVLFGVFSGHKLHHTELLGLLISFMGVFYLVMPGLATPSTTGFILMSIAGVSWGLYTLEGKSSKNPLSDTTYNFLRTLPFVAILIAFTVKTSTLTQTGILLAILSGGIASGIGYTIWYMALSEISNIQAAVVQLFVPVIATVGGILFADEILSVRLMLSSVTILGGILIVILRKQHYEPENIWEMKS